MSTGLYYAPGSYSTTEEVIALAKVAAADGGIYDTHMRDESTYNIGLLAAVRETIRIGRKDAHARHDFPHQSPWPGRVGAEPASDRIGRFRTSRRRAGDGESISLRCIGNECRSLADTALGGGWGLIRIVAAD